MCALVALDNIENRLYQIAYSNIAHFIEMTKQIQFDFSPFLIFIRFFFILQLDNGFKDIEMHMMMQIKLA